MTTSSKANFSSEPSWGSSYRLIASEKWKAKSAAMGKAVTDALVEYARPKPGMRVLDLASGTGEPAISLAVRVGEQGQVTALDLSAELLEIAKGRAEERGLNNFSTQQADAHALQFADSSFDLATCRFGVMFFRDPVLAIGEVRRVLRSGSRACFLAWGTFDQPYFQTTMGVVHRHVGGPPLQPGGPDPFRFAEPGTLSTVLKTAGFREVEEETKKLPWTWPGTPEEVWEQLRSIAVPFGPMLDRVPSEMWPRIHAEVRAAIGQYVDGENIAFGASVVLASGSK
ncbi:MAG TPA: methyltransferase domain-containing protein [Candidatus Acidoferrum sp.]|jgi:SAM-dependent methyltransferase|nr:methyltransferase domain-containing protein [Candidatus Acidoferrum sp.]